MQQTIAMQATTRMIKIIKRMSHLIKVDVPGFPQSYSNFLRH